MARYRMLLDGGGVYHVVSRVVDRRFVFGEEEKRVFRRLLGRLLGFSGLGCLTYCLMSNHFHLLVAVPDGERFREGLTDEEFLRRLGYLYRGAEFEEIRAELGRLRESSPAEAEALRGRYMRRMADLPAFMQELKRRFSRWYNRREGRRGTLWEERYRSVAVEEGAATEMVAAYIDLNPVRAGKVSDPKDYRWCGYGEAVAGGAEARAGLVRAIDPWGSTSGWPEVQAAYRQLLYGAGEGRGLEPEAVAAVLRDGGKLTTVQLLRCRLRYLCDGGALGTREFVERVFAGHRGWFAAGRKSGGRRLRGGDWRGLVGLRTLSGAIVAPGGTGSTT
jgi:REP element-mobilizing transposase RayT